MDELTRRLVDQTRNPVAFLQDRGARYGARCFGVYFLDMNRERQNTVRDFDSAESALAFMEHCLGNCELVIPTVFETWTADSERS